MHRIDSNLISPTPPVTKPASTPGYFQDDDPLTGGTEVTADWLNAVQEEPIAVIAAAGISLSKTDNGQLLAALRKLFNPRYVGLRGGTQALTQTAANTYTYTLADFKDKFEIPFDALAGVFEVGETVTGATSGATAVVVAVESSYLVVDIADIPGLPGPFQNDEEIEGSVSGATANVNEPAPEDATTGLNFIAHDINPTGIRGIWVETYADRQAAGREGVYAVMPDGTEVVLNKVYSSDAGTRGTTHVTTMVPINSGQTTIVLRIDADSFTIRGATQFEA